MSVRGLHHVAYRCKDAKATTDFYTKFLDLDFNIAVAENLVPSTGEWSPHIHIFFQMDDGSFVAFFEVPESKDMILDPNTPDWVQHLALTVKDEATLLSYKKRLEDGGISVVGPTDHKICKSIYFFDPNGHRLELAVDTTTPEMLKVLRARADQMLSNWTKTKRAPDLDPLHAHLQDARA
jgi:catechol 2,3-dioxygenase-like lactoylglutathione lyase family enzyme